MEWNRGPIIGRGSSAVVSLATTSSGDLLAVKSTELSSSCFLQRETNILSKMNSPFIVKYLGYDIRFEDDKHMYNMLMEYLSGGTLLDVIKKQGGSLDESMICVCTKQILQGLDYLHSNNFMHCDIKGQNILVGKDGVKIADLGCAASLENGVAAKSAFSGTPVFMAPEVARGQEQGFPADIWALGCTIIEMATGTNPWPELDDPVSAIYTIGFSDKLPNFPNKLSHNAKDFLSKCLKRDAKERWTAKQLLDHPFLVELPLEHENVEKFDKYSPTSVLDLGFWDSIEVSEPCFSPSQVVYSSDYAAKERIARLMASQFLPAQWANDEDWVTVRINSAVANSAQLSQQNCEDISFDAPSLVQLELNLTSVNEEDSESYTDNQIFLVLDSSLVQVNSNVHISGRTNNVLSTVIDVSTNVSKIPNFDRKINENLLFLIMNVVPVRIL